MGYYNIKIEKDFSRKFCVSMGTHLSKNYKQAYKCFLNISFIHDLTKHRLIIPIVNNSHVHYPRPIRIAGSGVAYNCA
jgi:hypothetical protein